MSSKFRLEVFELPQESGDQLHMSESDLEETRLASFEKGYQAGWDDAVAAQVNEAAKTRADLARNLQEMHFTYQEARTHILRSIEPLLRDMVAKVLPAIARASLAQTALEALKPLAEELSEAPLTVVVNPVNRRVVEQLLTQKNAPKFQCVEEPSLGEAQVYLRHGNSETRVDLDGVIAAIGKALEAFFEAQREQDDE